MWNLSDTKGKIYVPYRDLSGGLNTLKSPFNINRNQLSLSQNGWNSAIGVYGKRQGNAAFASGATGSGFAAVGGGQARFAGVTSLIAQTSAAMAVGRYLYWARSTDIDFTKITTEMGSGALPISCAQMYDPDYNSGAGATTVFICNGVDVPWQWTGPTATTMTQVTTGSSGGLNYLPQNHSDSAPITPKYVATLGATPFLIYAGEPTEPCGVYISDAFFPQRFDRSATLATPTAAPQQPLLVGFNDGVAGGDITGILALGQSLIVYKQAAIYAVYFGQGQYGSVVTQVMLVSGSVGCTSPRSIVQMDSTHCFLSMDGVYELFPAFTQSGFDVRKVSKNVPTFFDPSFTGQATILNDSTAVGTRIGPTYIVYYDAGVNGNPAGYPNRGMWFNFDVPDSDKLPTAGEILGMAPVAFANFRGPTESGFFAWCSGAADQAGLFGSGYTDFGAAITTTFAGKIDYMSEFYDPGAPLKEKVIDSIWLELAIPQASLAQVLTFSLTITQDLYSFLQTSGQTTILPGVAGAVVGTGVVGTAVIGLPPSGFFYQAVKVSGPYPSNGLVLGAQWQETSKYGWNCLGYDILVDSQQVSQ
jgi:hypothetical protein